MADIYSLIPKSFSRTDTASYTLDDIRKEVNEICVWLDCMWGHEKKMQNVQFRICWNEKPRPKSLGLCCIIIIRKLRVTSRHILFHFYFYLKQRFNLMFVTVAFTIAIALRMLVKLTHSCSC